MLRISHQQCWTSCHKMKIELSLGTTVQMQVSTVSDMKVTVSQTVLGIVAVAGMDLEQWNAERIILISCLVSASDFVACNPNNLIWICGERDTLSKF